MKSSLVEVLKKNTSESIAVVRVGDLVVKHLRPCEYFAAHANQSLRMSATHTLERWKKMVSVSRHPPLNQLWLVLTAHACYLISQFIPGPHATGDVLQETICRVEALELGILDVANGDKSNVIVGPHGPVVVDWFMR
jgi:hypothetical protein